MNTNLKSERQEFLAKQILDRGSMSVPELARLLEVSEITIRRDLEELDKTGVINRVRGGARRPNPRGEEPPVVQRLTLQMAEKQAIGQAAASLIEDGEVIGILSGSTPQELARAIARKLWSNLIIVTNALMVVQELMRIPGIQIILVGGTIDQDEMGTFGILAVDTVKNMRLHKLFTGCRGIDPATGISNDLRAEPEVAVVRAFAQISDQVIVIADHTKIGNTFLIPTLPIEKIDVLVTDMGAGSLNLNKFRKQDVQIILAPMLTGNPNNS